jgi:hypothetical protein
VLVPDQFTDLIGANPAFLSILPWLWDTRLGQTPLQLLLEVDALAGLHRRAATFSRTGFTPALATQAAADGVLLVTLADVCGATQVTDQSGP